MNINEMVSVIMPAYNSEQYIKEAITSVLNQTYKNLELLITDDHSSDSTRSIVSEYEKIDGRVKLFTFDKNKGAAEARNNSIRNSKGRYLAFLDSDDIWINDKLKNQLLFMHENKIVFSFTGYSIYHGNGLFEEKIIDGCTSEKIAYHDLLKKTCTVGCSTVILDRLAFDSIEMPNIRTGQDYALWLKLLRDSRGFAHNYKNRLTGYRILKGSISRNKLKKARRQWQIYREIEKISILPSMYYMIFYIKNAVIRK